MKRNLKALGLVIAAVLAMSAFASAAQATDFHVSAAPATSKGTQSTTHHFKTGTFDVTCEIAEFEGTQSTKTAATQTMTAKYDKCHVIILFTFAATVNMNGCDYLFNANGDVTLECPAGKVVEITSAGCNVTIGAQKIVGGAEYKNNATKTELTVVAKGKGITYHQIGSSCATKNGNDAEYTGNTLVKATSGGAATNVWWE